MSEKAGVRIRIFPWMSGRGLNVSDMMSPPEIQGDKMVFHFLDNKMRIATLYLAIQADQTIIPLIGYEMQPDNDIIEVKVCGVFQIQVQKDEWVTIDLSDLPKDVHELLERTSGKNFSVKTIEEKGHE